MTRRVPARTARRRPPRNRLVAALPRVVAQKLLARCEVVELKLGEILYEPGVPIRHVYFPTDCFISLMIAVDGATNLEVGLVGDEGMLGLPLVLGVDASPLRALVQGAGPAWRMSAVAFSLELGRSAVLRNALHGYLQVCMDQLAQTAGCTRFHVVEQRLARWLLMTQDRAHRDEFRVTHEFLAYMLGVRRVGITKAATALQERHLIRYHRGEVAVLDRKGLEAASCSCYQKGQETYDGLLASK